MGATPGWTALHQNHPDIVIVEVGQWGEDATALDGVVVIGFSCGHLASVHASLPVLRLASPGPDEENSPTVLSHDVSQQPAGWPDFHPVRAPPKIPGGRYVSSPYHTNPKCLIDGRCGNANVNRHFLFRGGISDHFERFLEMPNHERRLDESVITDNEDGSLAALWWQSGNRFPDHLQEKGGVLPSRISNNPGMDVLSAVLPSKGLPDLLEACR